MASLRIDPQTQQPAGASGVQVWGLGLWGNSLKDSLEGSLQIPLRAPFKVPLRAPLKVPSRVYSFTNGSLGDSGYLDSGMRLSRS